MNTVYNRHLRKYLRNVSFILEIGYFFTIRNSVDVDSSGSHVCADQEPYFFSLRTQEDLQTLTDWLYFRKKRASLSCCPFTLKRSKLFFRSLGLRSPWRQTQESWWPLLSGPTQERPILREDSEFVVEMDCFF